MLALCPEQPLARPKSKIYTPKQDNEQFPVCFKDESPPSQAKLLLYNLVPVSLTYLIPSFVRQYQCEYCFPCNFVRSISFEAMFFIGDLWETLKPMDPLISVSMLYQ